MILLDIFNNDRRVSIFVSVTPLASSDKNKNLKKPPVNSSWMMKHGQNVVKCPPVHYNCIMTFCELVPLKHPEYPPLFGAKTPGFLNLILRLLCVNLSRA